MSPKLDIEKSAGLILAVLSGSGLFVLVVLSFYWVPRYTDGVSTGIDALKTVLAMSLSFLFGVHQASPPTLPPGSSTSKTEVTQTETPAEPPKEPSK